MLETVLSWPSPPWGHVPLGGKEGVRRGAGEGINEHVASL